MNYVLIGKLCGSHGLKGEIKLDTDFQYLDRVLQEGTNLYIGDNKTNVTLLKSRRHNKYELLTFNDYEDINLVENFKNNNVYVLRDDLNLNEDEFVFEDYIGLEAYFNNEKIGIINDIIDYGMNNYVFVIGEKEVLIPVKQEFIDKVILNDKVILKEVGDLIDAN